MTDVHVHIHLAEQPEPDWAKRIERQLRTIKEIVVATREEFTGTLKRIDDATTDIAEDLRRLRAEIAGGMTTEQEASVLADLDAAAAALEAVARDPENPVPEPPVEPPAA